MQYLCDISPHVTLSTIDINAPITHAKILDNFRARILEIKGAPGFTDQSKIVVVTDAITSNPGLYMPWQQVVQICREEGAWSIVDAAHSIGQEMNINLSESKPDFWISVRRYLSFRANKLNAPYFLLFSTSRTVTSGYT
jgi:cysteine sulfinate desulfinase/cysteine desulfurase-like protein